MFNRLFRYLIIIVSTKKIIRIQFSNSGVIPPKMPSSTFFFLGITCTGPHLEKISKHTFWTDTRWIFFQLAFYFFQNNLFIYFLFIDFFFPETLTTLYEKTRETWIRSNLKWFSTLLSFLSLNLFKQSFSQVFLNSQIWRPG